MTALRNRKVLVLNKGWNAIGVVTLERAIIMLFSEYADKTPKARIIDPTRDFQTFSWEDWSEMKPRNGEDTIKGINMVFRVPEIIVLTKYDKLPQHKIHFSRRTIYKRDCNTCFVGDTLVLMSDLSLKPISEVQVGDKVLDAYGDEQVIEYVHSRYSQPDEVVSIKHRGNGDPLVCTKDHKILGFAWNGDMVSGEEGVPAGDMTINNYLSEIVPSIKGERGDEFDLYEFASGLLPHVKLDGDKVKHYCGTPQNRYISLNKDLGRLCGYYLSEGSTTNNTVVFSLNAMTEGVYAEEIATLLKDIFGLDSRWETNGNKGNVICHSSLLSLFFSEYFGKGDAKHVGMKPNYEFLKGILYGVCRGDAAFNNEQSRCTVMMSRPSLIRDLYVVSLVLGLCPSLSKTGVRKDGRIYKTINFNAADFNTLAEMSVVPHVEWQPSKGNKTDRNKVGNRLISKITEIKQVEYNGLVYDLQVSGSHTYVANFVCVHNCQYCGSQPGTEELTIDHIMPRSCGGKTTWENCVLACVGCNSKKADIVPDHTTLIEHVKGKDVHVQAFTVYFNDKTKKTIKQPKKPTIPLFRGDIRIKSWEAFLGEAYWNTTLANDNDDDD